MIRTERLGFPIASPLGAIARNSALNCYFKFKKYVYKEVKKEIFQLPKKIFFTKEQIICIKLKLSHVCIFVN